MRPVLWRLLRLLLFPILLLGAPFYGAWKALEYITCAVVFVWTGRP